MQPDFCMTREVVMRRLAAILAIGVLLPVLPVMEDDLGASSYLGGSDVQAYETLEMMRDAESASGNYALGERVFWSAEYDVMDTDIMWAEADGADVGWGVSGNVSGYDAGAEAPDNDGAEYVEPETGDIVVIEDEATPLSEFAASGASSSTDRVYNWTYTMMGAALMLFSMTGIALIEQRVYGTGSPR